jgi:DtxR family Mn-dependent transcriptional regulator
MEGADLVEINSGAIRLRPDGLALAETVVRRHRLAERFLTDMLGLSWAEAHDEAGRWEHIISPTVEVAMMRALGDPTTCPHGNPIPGTDYQPPSSVTLDTLLVGQSFTVSRIPEELEFTPGLLEFLETSSLLPGHSGVITELVAGGITIVEIDGQTVEITQFATQRILVTAA